MCVHVDPVLFLGYLITSSGIRVDESKVATIRDWPSLFTITEAQSFHGLASLYRRFIVHFSTIMAHVTDCIGRKPFMWIAEAEDVFSMTKQHLTLALILLFPDFNHPFELACDALKGGHWNNVDLGIKTCVFK